MIVDRSREDLEADLAAALSRHIGYTTGAYRIERIASIVSEFPGKPSLYQFELLQYLMTHPKEGRQRIDEDYASQILNFATGLRIIAKVAEGPTPGVMRFALTPEGATIKSALTRDEKELAKFTLLGLVLESDCDAYALLLDILDNTAAPGTGLHSLFRERFQTLRRERAAWLEQAFPDRILRDRMVSKVMWLIKQAGQVKLRRELSNDFARHHVTPRLGWARWFGHLTTRKEGSNAPVHVLTSTGCDLLHVIRQQSTHYTWLGPPTGTQEALRIKERHQLPGPCSPSWDLLRPKAESTSTSDVRILADQLSAFMHNHYDNLKLVHANQAAVQSVLPYLFLTERELGVRVPVELVLSTVFGTKSSFALLSTRRTKYGYYQRRRR